MLTDSEKVRRKLSSFSGEIEEIIVKPSTELIPDEYEHSSADSVLVHIFRIPWEEEASIANEILQTLQQIGYNKLQEEENVHDLAQLDEFEHDLEIIKKNSAEKTALILIISGIFKKDGSFILLNSDGSEEDYHVKNVWNKFSSNNCPELKDKPKIFIFCTSKKASAIQMDSSTRRPLESFDKVYDYPTEADLLIVFKKINESSLLIKSDFVSQICKNITTYHNKYDVIDLLAHTSNVENSPPLITISTLTRKFYLTMSHQRDHHLALMQNNEKLEQSLKEIRDNFGKLEAIENKFQKKNNIFKKSETTSKPDEADSKIPTVRKSFNSKTKPPWKY